MHVEQAYNWYELLHSWPIILGVCIVGLLLMYIICRLGNVVRYIPNDHVGIPEKMFSFKGSVKGGFIALNGEAGYQPELLRGGFHFFKPFIYRIHVHPLISVPQGKIAYVYARDGLVLPPTQTLARNSADEDFTDVRAFLLGGGQRGLQRRILREGTYAINLAQFIVLCQEETFEVELGDLGEDDLLAMRNSISERNGFVPIVIHSREDKIGIVTVHDGPPLDSGEIIAPEIRGHSNFQMPESFIAGGGRRGRQLQPLVEGTYYINRLFASVEAIDKTVIEQGEVGVVISYAGEKGTDLSGDKYGHGELVETGCKGVWRDPLLPGKYAFNTYAGHIEKVPTVNFVLKWVREAEGSHALDESLSEVNLITKDAFEPVLPLSVVLHIDYRKASELVQRFGNVKKLVEQTLDPMVSAYFKNVGQRQTLIELLQNRAEIQTQAKTEMAAKFSEYTLEFQEVLIGTPKPKVDDVTMEQILIQLRMRQVAKEQQITYDSQKEAAEKQKELNEASATAEVQFKLTQSLIQVDITNNEGLAKVRLAENEANQIKLLADANQHRVDAEGKGEAAAILAKGEATAKATKSQVEAYGGPEFRLAEQVANRMFEAISAGKQPVVPEIVVTSSGSQSGGEGSSNSIGIAGLYTGVMAGMLPMIRDMRSQSHPQPHLQPQPDPQAQPSERRRKNG